MRAVALPLLGLLLLLLAGPIAAQSREELMAEYARRYAALDQGSVPQLVELAAWCEEKKLRTYANLLYRKALKLDPANERANAGLGHVQVEGRWYPPAEAAKVRERLAGEQRAAQERAAAAGRVDPLVVTDEAKRREEVRQQLAANRAKADGLAAAYREASGRTGYAAAISEHVTVVAKASAEDAQRYAEIGEYVYRRLSWISCGESDAHSFRDDGNRHLFYLTEPDAAKVTLEFVARQHPNVARWNDVLQQARSIAEFGLQFTAFHRPPCLVHLRVETQSSAVANTMARSLLQHNAASWYREPDLGTGAPKEFSMMAWLLEGVGIWASLEATGRNEVYRVHSRYERRFIKDEDPPPNYPAMAHAIVTDGGVEGTSARAFPQLCRLRLDSWNDADLAMAFALVDYLIRGRTEDWRGLFAKLPGEDSLRVAFVRQLGTEDETTRLAKVLRERDDAGLDAVFDHVAERFERDWRQWVRTAYPGFRDDPDKHLREAPFPDKR